jgi:hypothetical protein
MKSAVDQTSFYAAADLRPRPRKVPVIALLALLSFAALSGLAIGFVGWIAAVVIVAAVTGLLSLILPVRYLVLLLLFIAFLVMGQLTYFAGISKAFWMPMLLGLVLFVRLPAELMRRNSDDPSQAPFSPRQSAAIVAAIAVYFSTAIATTLINMNPALQIFVSSKEYLFMWGLYFTIATGLIHPDLLQKIWDALPWLMPVQIPIVLYQRFVVAPRREAIDSSGAAWDAVVGAFGGDPTNGGNSGAMGLFIGMFIALSIVRWRNGLMRPWHCLLIVLSGLLTIMLAEVKFAVMMLPVAVAAAYLREFIRKPVIAIGFCLAAATISMGLLSAYQMQYWNSYLEKKQKNYVAGMLAEQLNTDRINMQTGEVGRISAITFWAAQQKNAADVLIGHGMGSSRKGQTVVGEVAKQWPFDIGRSSLAILLWETGVIGASAFVALLVAGFLRAYQLSGNVSLPLPERTVLMGCCAIFFLSTAELAYNTDAFGAPQMQILIMLALAQVAVSGGRVRLANSRERIGNAG